MNKGFSLIELLIVVAIILIIAAIAVPNLLRARRTANEASAVQSLKAIQTGQLMYQSTYGNFTTLAELSKDGGIPPDLGSGAKSGYTFTSGPGENPAQQFTATGAPTVSTGAAATGTRTFFTDETLVIRFAIGSQANATSAPIGSPAQTESQPDSQ